MSEWVAHNRLIPIEIMEILAGDANERVRFKIAAKNRLSEHIQLILANDSVSSVRQRIAYNKKSTLQVLSILLTDEDKEIRMLAKTRIDEGRYK